MRYIIIDGNISAVYSVTQNGRRISNPPDELIDQLGAGYPLETDPQPEYDEEKYYLVATYSMENKVIKKHWEIKEIENDSGGSPEIPGDLEQRVTALEEENAALREAIEAGVNM